MVVHGPPLLDPEVSQHVLGRGERPVAVAQRGPHAVVAEADDVGVAVAGQVDREAGVQASLPALGGVEADQHHPRGREGPVPVTQRGPHAVVPEAQEVGLAVAVQVSQDALVHVGPPALVIAEVGDHELRGGDGPVAVAERRPYAVVTEADDVSVAVAGQVDRETRVQAGLPALAGAEVGERQPRGGEGPVPVTQRGPHAFVTEAHEVGLAVAVQVSQDALVHVGPPALVIAEVGDHELRGLETAVPVADRGPRASVAEADDVQERPAAGTGTLLQWG